MIISFSGEPGSGKSSIAKMLAKKLNWPRYYIGGLRRQRAAEKGMTLAEYNRLGETDPATDLEVDEYQKQLGETSDNFIIEGRTSWYFIPHSFKIYLDVDPREGAARVYRQLQKKSSRNEDKNLKTADDVMLSHAERKQSDIKRYKKYFNIDVYDTGRYELVINTSGKTIKETFDLVYPEVLKAIENEKKNN